MNKNYLNQLKTNLYKFMNFNIKENINSEI